jgi:hypothetical protein
MVKFSPFCGDRPQTDDQRRDEFYRRLSLHKMDELMERIEELDQLIGMGEVPHYLRRQAS